jgi:hypothetical protein
LGPGRLPLSPPPWAGPVYGHSSEQPFYQRRLHDIVYIQHHNYFEKLTSNGWHVHLNSFMIIAYWAIVWFTQIVKLMWILVN